MLHTTLIQIADHTLGNTPASAGAEIAFMVLGIALSILVMFSVIKLLDWLTKTEYLGAGFGAALILGIGVGFLFSAIPSVHAQRFSQCETRTSSYLGHPTTETWCSTRTDLSTEFTPAQLRQIQLVPADGH